MKYELLAPLSEGTPTWLARDTSNGAEVLAHRVLPAPDGVDLMGPAMQILVRGSEEQKASILDFIEQDGCWLLVTQDAPEHRDIQRWLTGGEKAEPQPAAPPADPVTFTRMFRAMSDAPPVAPAPPVATPATPTEPDAAPAPGAFTQFFLAGDPRSRAPEPAMPAPAAVAPPPPPDRTEPVAPGAFTQFFTAGDAGVPSPPTPAPEPAPFRVPEASPPAAPTPGAFTQFFAAGGAAPPATSAEPRRNAPPGHREQKPGYTQVFSVGNTPPPRALQDKSVRSEPAPPVADSAPKPAAPAPASPVAGSFTALFSSPSASPPAAPTSPPGPVPAPPRPGFLNVEPLPPPEPTPVVSEYTRILAAAQEAPAPKPAKPAAAAKPPVPKPRVSPTVILFGVVAILAIALVAFLLLRPRPV